MNHSKLIFIPLMTLSILSLCKASRAAERVAYFHDNKPQFIQASYADCQIILSNDTLIIKNAQIARKFRFNNGNLISLSLTDNAHPYQWSCQSSQTDCSIPGLSKSPDSGYLVVDTIATTSVSPAYLQASIYTKSDKLEVKRVLKIYPNCPAIECIYYLRGSTNKKWWSQSTSLGNLSNIESLNKRKETPGAIPIMESISLGGRHWNIQCIEFKDITDRNNNLVNEVNQVAYRQPAKLIGNLLYATDAQNDHGIFLLKEAPNTQAQLDYPGYDFLSSLGKFQVIGIGIQPSDLDTEGWVRAYGFVIGVTYGGQLNKMQALRDYQSKIRIHKPGRDDMVLMNTWGDRNQDKSISAFFIEKELVKAAKLGISHFQIDDGWQTGRSSNSAFKGGSLIGIWNNKDYWMPDPKKFPRGLKPIVDLGKKLGIEICLWFNPSKDSSYLNWRSDAQAIIKLYKTYGIRTFKIDGVQVNDKRSDIRLRRMFDTIMEVTQKKVVFNLDVTAGKRYGYHYFNEYGNIFLENRYTDWGNYYPFWTLRNLWQLSKYVPPQNLQIEFLNIFRNIDKYPVSDSFAPAKMGFDYCFALTMMAQPLAWMEATGLPAKAFNISPIIKKYRSYQTDIHQGQIFPIGKEPSGKSWTGFQSILNAKEGYLLILRELNPLNSTLITTWLPKGKSVKLKLILGQGQDHTIKTTTDGKLPISLIKENSYVLYHYTIVD
jgi:hypothetical protein